MQDTPQPIKDLQLEIWLAKPPMERLRQFLIDNDAFFQLIKEIKENRPASNPMTDPDQFQAPLFPAPNNEIRLRYFFHAELPQHRHQLTAVIRTMVE